MRLLILDIDQTIVHASQSKFLEREADFFIPHPFGDFLYYKRPYLDEFLSQVKDWFCLALWSSSDKYYVQQVKEHIFSDIPIEFAWDRSKCTYVKKNGIGIYEKPLQKLGKLHWSLSEVLIIDDTPEKLTNYPKNYLPIKSWYGNEEDNELIKMLEILKEYV
ncbi:MAG: HAD family hydrolase [Thermoflexibacter sp.]|nr:HAD family hydrolase [Thermoflexibacter sp.]